MARPRGGGAHIPLAYQGATHPIVRVRIVYGPTQRYAEVAAYVPYVAYPAKHGKGEDGGPASVRMAYRGFVHLLACKWLYTAGAPTPYSWRFAAAWCGPHSIAQIGGAMTWLLKRGYVRHVGTHERTALFLPGSPERAREA